MISIQFSNGNSANVPWTNGMSAQDALELAYSVIVFGASYYGSTLGYYVTMVDGTHDSPSSDQYWAFYHNGVLSSKGINLTILNDGDIISFVNTKYSSAKHQGTQLEIKHMHAETD